ncbi:MAG: sugar phosphate isomerase/epimerase [Candidatus Latescibacteria bacterium]|nr:sugar phosphate isomerase/epimerase [Candidatus Latescibacterota bacterium]
MQLSLSVRVAESFRNKRNTTITLPELAAIAKNAGYEALCMRASGVGTHSKPEDVAKVKTMLFEHGLLVSMVTGDFAIPENGTEGPNSLRHITPHLNLAEELSCDLLRLCIKTDEDIPFAQRAADEAAERDIRLSHQCHTQSLFETVEGSLETLRSINRPNFGIIYEPANLALCGQDYGRETLKRLSPYLFNVYLQNHVPDPNGNIPMTTWVNGTVNSTLRPLDESGGIDFNRVFEGLKAVNYKGYVTLHHAFGGDLPPNEAATKSVNFLKSFL